MLLWVCNGAFRYRAVTIEKAYERSIVETEPGKQHNYAPHPHPQHPFQSMPPLEVDPANRGLRLRTVMITNIPPRLRSENELKEYIEYHMSRPLAKPSLGLTSTTHPGLINRLVSLAYNAAKSWRVFSLPLMSRQTQDEEKAQRAGFEEQVETKENQDTAVVVERVVIVRKMTELASLIDRREEVLKRLETAHIKLAKKVLKAVKLSMVQREYLKVAVVGSSSEANVLPSTRDEAGGNGRQPLDTERGQADDPNDSEDRMKLLIRTLGPFVKEFGVNEKTYPRLSYDKLANLLPRQRWKAGDEHVDTYLTAEAALQTSETGPSNNDERTTDGSHPTIWDALFSLPRSTLDYYQPLIHLSALFRGKTVPTIDFYTAKLGLLTSFINESRDRSASDFEAASSAFVTFSNPDHARRACTYLAVHPRNPFACFVAMAPEFEDLDWVRLMKTTFKAEVCVFQ